MGEESRTLQRQRRRRLAQATLRQSAGSKQLSIDSRSEGRRRSVSTVWNRCMRNAVQRWQKNQPWGRHWWSIGELGSSELVQCWSYPSGITQHICYSFAFVAVRETILPNLLLQLWHCTPASSAQHAVPPVSVSNFSTSESWSLSRRNQMFYMSSTIANPTLADHGDVSGVSNIQSPPDHGPSTILDGFSECQYALWCSAAAVSLVSL